MFNAKLSCEFKVHIDPVPPHVSDPVASPCFEGFWRDTSRTRDGGRCLRCPDTAPVLVTDPTQQMSFYSPYAGRVGAPADLGSRLKQSGGYAAAVIEAAQCTENCFQRWNRYQVWRT